MADPFKFLTSLAQALSTMALYTTKHPARERAIDRSFSALRDLQAEDPKPQFSFLGEETVYGQISLLELRQFDEYTTTHSLNVSVLTMALAEYMGLAAREVRTFGVAGLLHDLGKVRVPLDILNKPGKLTDEERAVIQRHPADGARLI